MFDIHERQDGPWQKSAILDENSRVENIKGLYRAEHYSERDIEARLENATKEKYRHDEMFKSWCSITDFIDAPIDFVWNYSANIYSLEEWSFSIRDLKYIGDGIYQGREYHHDTDIFIQNEAIKEAHVVDYRYAWDQKKELWVRHFLRFIDAKDILNRRGTLMLWSHFKHPYHERCTSSSPEWLKDAQNKKNRVWMGQKWPYVYAAQKLLADNLRFILEHRYHNRK